MIESLNAITDDYPFVSGLIHFNIAILIFLLFIGTKQSYKSKDYSAEKWKALMSVWVVVLALIVRGIVIIVRS